MNKPTKKRSRVRFAKDDDPIYSRGWTITTRVWGRLPNSDSRPEDTGEEVTKVSRASGGWAKPDDPIYKRGWTIAPIKSGRRQKR
jgi:hypothetical protein